MLWADPGDGPLIDYEREYLYCATCGTAYDPDTWQILATYN
ncbi:hypothetical protein TPY_2724 [Sulfobacillus acidophilus TPY]|nr:hypothetical protein TPY_2724 [Sulfobacillus acidophilus TPY]